MPLSSEHSLSLELKKTPSHLRFEPANTDLVFTVLTYLQADINANCQAMSEINELWQRKFGKVHCLEKKKHCTCKEFNCTQKKKQRKSKLNCQKSNITVMWKKQKIRKKKSRKDRLLESYYYSILILYSESLSHQRHIVYFSAPFTLQWKTNKLKNLKNFCSLFLGCSLYILHVKITNFIRNVTFYIAI